MRALTVQQPWAWAIAHGGKTIENRSAGFPAGHRGPVAIHAGRRWSERGGHDERVVDAQLKLVNLPGVPDLARDHARAKLITRGLIRGASAYPMGVIVAVAELVEVHPDGGCCRPWGESLYPEGGGRVQTDLVHLVLEGVIALPHPVRAPGQLGLWTLPDEIEAAVRAEILSVLHPDDVR